MWDPHTGKLMNILMGHPYKVFSVAYSPDGETLVSVGSDEICLWEAHTGKLLKMVRGYRSFTGTVAYSPDGTRLASGGSDGVYIWDVHSRQHSQTFTADVTHHKHYQITSVALRQMG